MITPAPTPAGFAGLARQIDALVTGFPCAAAEVSVPGLLDDIGMLNHYLNYIAEYMRERFSQPDKVGLAERTVLAEIAGEAEQIAKAQRHLTSALAHVAAGLRKELMLHTHPHLANDPALARTIAAEKYAEAGTRLCVTARRLDSIARGGQRATTTPPRTRPSPAANSVLARR